MHLWTYHGEVIKYYAATSFSFFKTKTAVSFNRVVSSIGAYLKETVAALSLHYCKSEETLFTICDRVQKNVNIT